MSVKSNEMRSRARLMGDRDGKKDGGEKEECQHIVHIGMLSKLLML